MDTAPRIGNGQTNAPPADKLQLLPVRFRRDPADRAGIDPQHGMMPAKRPEAYYLDALPAVFQPDVALPGPLGVAEKFAGAEVILLNPGTSSAEVLGILTRFPEIKCLHVIESSEANLAAIRSQLGAEAGDRPLPELAGYCTDLRHLPEALAGRADLVVAINIFDPKADRLFRQDAVDQISRVLKLGGLFYSGGVTIRWTDEVTPLSLVTIPVAAELLERVGYSDALPPPVFFLKRPTDAPIPTRAEAEEGTLREWWNKVVSLIGSGAEADEAVAVEAPFVPRVEAGRGEPNAAPWNFLITKPAIRRPAMEWTPKADDPFGNLTLSTLLQHNPETGMRVFRVREHPEVVLKLMKPFEGDIPDDPLDWEKLSKSKTLKRENQALKLLKGLRFIPQRIAHGYDPLTGWYAIVVEYEASSSLDDFMDRQYHRHRRHHETAAEVEGALQAVLMVLNSLEIVHGKGLVHQDLKPGHVLLRPDSREAVLIDWGLARRIDEPLSEEKRSISWLHAPPERADIDVLAHAAIHQDLYAVGVMLLQLGSDVDLKPQPRFLFDYFLKHGCMPTAAELETGLRLLWKWAAPVIARAISSRKDRPGYANHRFTSAAEMARELVQRHGKTPAALPAHNLSDREPTPPHRPGMDIGQ
jgi:serine/threonine protein kinase